MKTRKTFIKMWLQAACLLILVAGTVTCLGPSSGPTALTAVVPAATLESAKKPTTELTPDPLKTLLVLATLVSKRIDIKSHHASNPILTVALILFRTEV